MKKFKTIAQFAIIIPLIPFVVIGVVILDIIETFKLNKKKYEKRNNTKNI